MSNTYTAQQIAQAAIDAHAAGTLCGQHEGAGLHYISDRNNFRCAIGAGLTPEDAWKVQKSIDYEIDKLVALGVLNITGDVDKLRQTQLAHDSANFTKMLSIAEEILSA